MAKHSTEELDRGQLDLMWNFLRFDCGQKSDITTLKEHLNMLRQAMIQKTSGQGRKDHKNDVDFGDIGTIVNCIVIETMQVYLAGDFDIIEKRYNPVEWEERTVEDENPYFRRRFYCTNCGDWNTNGKTKYCPDCGARMKV